MMSAHSRADKLPAEPSDVWFTPGCFAIVLALGIFAAYPEVVLGLQTFYYRDFGFFGYPLAHYHRASFWQGEIPQWNPLNNCGLPFLAQWNTLVLYPGSLFYLLFPLSWSLAVFCLLHQFLAGMGMFFLASRWTGNRLAAAVAGAAYAFNGLTLNCLMWPNNIAALGWMPWVLLTSQGAWTGGKRNIAAAVVVGAMQMLSGAPEIILLTWITLAVLAAAQSFQGFRVAGRVCWRLAATGLLVAGISAAQLFPFLDLLRHAHRDAGYGDSAWAMPVWGWANLLVPMFHSIHGFHGVYWQREQYWTSSYYPGAVIVAFALLAVCARERKARVFAFMAVLGLVLAFGDAGVLYGGLRQVIPQFGFMRYPVKFLVLLSFALPLLAAYAVAHFLKPIAASDLSSDFACGSGATAPKHSAGGQEGNSAIPSAGHTNLRRRAWATAGIVWLLLLGIMIAVVWYARLHPARDENWTLTWKNGLARALFLTLTLGGFYMYGRLSTNPPLTPPRRGKQPADGGIGSPPAEGVEVGSGSHTRVAVRGLFLQRGRFVVGVALVLLVVSDLLTHMPRQNPTVPRVVYQPGLLRLSPQPRHGDGRAMISPANNLKLYRFATTNALNDYINNRRLLFANCNLLDSIPKLNGFYSLYLREGDAVRAFLYDSTNTPPSALCDFLGVSQITDPEDFLEWKYRPGYLPLASVGQKPVFADESTTFKAITSAEFNPRSTVYLPPAARPLSAAPHELSGEAIEKKDEPKITKANFTAHRGEIQVEAQEGSWLVIAQTFYHPWRAFVDGVPAKVWRANYAFQTVEVPKGRHVVDLAYCDWGFVTGAVLSVLTLTGCFGAVVCRVKRGQ